MDAASREHERLRRTATALREQSHEFGTRLHVIHGLISHGDTREALDYIDEVSPVLTAESDETLTGQPLLRATIDAIRAELGALGTRLETEVSVEHEIHRDLLLAIANLCRNAGEAGAARVRCTIEQRGDRLVVAIEDADTRDLPLAQGEIDRLLSTGRIGVAAPNARAAARRPAPGEAGAAASAGAQRLPKGLSEITLARVVEALDPVTAISAAELSERCSISRATARRYLDHLVSEGTIDLAHRYGGRGRPEALHRLAPAPLGDIDQH